MFKKATWLHLRIPFSYFLLPIFLFGVSLSPNLSEANLLGLLIILHFFIYPASNAFNSYFDKDEQSIGGLKNPPPVDKNVFYIAQIFDGLGLLLAYFFFPNNISLWFMLLIYILVSRAYSHPLLRLKKYAWLSWGIAGFFQGAWVIGLTYIGLNNFPIDSLVKPHVAIPGLLASALLWGSYPMTQIYQHEEDAARGDRTLSIKLGKTGTFYFTAIFFALASLGFFLYFESFHAVFYGYAFLISMLPILSYFLYWFAISRRHPEKINYHHTMALNWISATCLNAFFLYFFLHSTQVLHVVGVY